MTCTSSESPPVITNSDNLNLPIMINERLFCALNNSIDSERDVVETAVLGSLGRAGYGFPHSGL